MEDKFSTWEYFKESNPIVMPKNETLIINKYDFKL